MKIAVIHENAETLLAEHGALLSGLASMGHEVSALAPGSGPETSTGFEALGVEYAMYPLSPRSLTPIADMGTLLHLKQILFRVRPGLVLSVGAKPVVYGSLAARLIWVGEDKRVFALVDGPGFAFAGTGFTGRLLARLAKPMYRAGFRSCDGVCFRSAGAEAFFRKLGVLDPQARTGVADQADPETLDRALLSFMGMIPTD
ncbi:glycosyl transferase group 1 [Pseudodesulfovibrio mercurii]|uniref:Glycosyl transferase group 1 n=1 Tax=Pseudodesulfovibrio mercurii TaxID=641491 RepID=F0JBM1_9BACT|nr:glycosyltransferase [Pseudodesulfovibrio mercurii]EGB15524.1 glycosyl transferase group 1 [Pseudodesulfovibrio mercurii]